MVVSVPYRVLPETSDTVTSTPAGTGEEFCRLVQARRRTISWHRHRRGQHSRCLAARRAQPMGRCRRGLPRTTQMQPPCARPRPHSPSRAAQPSPDRHSPGLRPVTTTMRRLRASAALPTAFPPPQLSSMTSTTSRRLALASTQWPRRRTGPHFPCHARQLTPCTMVRTTRAPRQAQVSTRRCPSALAPRSAFLLHWALAHGAKRRQRQCRGLVSTRSCLSVEALRTRWLEGRKCRLSRVRALDQAPTTRLRSQRAQRSRSRCAYLH